MCPGNHSFQTHRRGIKSLLNHPSDSEVQYNEYGNILHNQNPADLHGIPNPADQMNRFAMTYYTGPVNGHELCEFKSTRHRLALCEEHTCVSACRGAAEVSRVIRVDSVECFYHCFRGYCFVKYITIDFRAIIKLCDLLNCYQFTKGVLPYTCRTFHSIFI